MKTYKLGNKIKCIIRSFAEGELCGQHVIANQPYTILKDVEASLTFKDFTKQGKHLFTELFYGEDSLQEVTISNVELTDKILSLIFSKQENNLCFTVENCLASDGQIFINPPSEHVCDVFIYDVDGQLENHLDELNTNQINVLRNEDYLVFYGFQVENSFNFNRQQEQYLTLDLIIEGNVDDTLNYSFIHINKCALQVNKNMYFNRSLNAVDLKFIIIDDGKNYITLEK